MHWRSMNAVGKKIMMEAPHDPGGEEDDYGFYDSFSFNYLLYIRFIYNSILTI